MKKSISFSIVALIFALVAFTSNVNAQNGKGKGYMGGKGKSTTTCTQFVDANGDGKCDNCGSTSGTCDGSGKGKGKGKGAGKGICDSSNCKNGSFVDANGDGVCDNKGTGLCNGTCGNGQFVDADGDGKCDNQGTGTCDGSGKGKGKGKGKCGTTVPTNFSLGVNVPNPALNVTKIPFNLKEESAVVISLYDSFGNKVKEILDSKMVAGDYSVDVNVSDLSAGNYVYTMTVNGKTISKNLSINR